MVINVSRIPAEGSINVNSVREVYGGTAGNFSMVASSLGLPFDLYSAVSEITHSSYLEFLSSRGVDISNILVDRNDRGPICYAASTGAEQVYFIYQGPMNRNFLTAKFRTDVEYNYLHLGTGDPSDLMFALDNGTYRNAVFDPGQELSYRYNRDQIMKFARKCRMAIFNDVEYRQIREITGIDEAGMLFPNLIVTHGKHGSTVREGNTVTEVKTLPAETVHDTVGAGDAFRAGVYLGLNDGLGLAEAAAMGSIVSSLAIGAPMSEFPYSGDQVRNMFREKKNELLVKR